MRELILNEEIHPRVIGELVPSARRYRFSIENCGISPAANRAYCACWAAYSSGTLTLRNAPGFASASRVRPVNRTFASLVRRVSVPSAATRRQRIPTGAASKIKRNCAPNC